MKYIQRSKKRLATINGNMHYFPLCCSTGILQDLTANYVRADGSYGWASTSHSVSEKKAAINKSKRIMDLIRNTRSMGLNYPFMAARWYALDLILLKVTRGKDDSGDHAYGNYKAAQVTFFDRYLEDKDPKKGFKFTYNTVYSCDHLTEWLSKQGDKYGEVYVSPAVPGAHKARVRGCVFTPNAEALEKYLKPRFNRLKKDLLEQLEAA